ncbi:MAG TPA: 50S ribosomal protein L23 [Fimbriimonadaceae bacterium]|nr:50S ribosomal protein L23 [Fimbriimonadaceae bacterium]HRJ32088.1 50S ribosomal protein L23 [Fimbriimonadaceae bacterium]
MKSPYEIIIKPHITEKTQTLSFGPNWKDDEKNVRKYTFIVDSRSNKIEIKRAIEAMYNEGKKAKDEKISVTSVRTINVKGTSRRVGFRTPGKTAGFKKAIITLAPGQMLEDWGV